MLIMTSSNQTCSMLREYLDMLDLDAPRGEQGRRMMLERLRNYFDWKVNLHASIQNQTNPSVNKDTGPGQKAGSAATSGDGELNEAMKKKDKARRDRAASRRRQRGGAIGTASTSQRERETDQEGMMKSEGLLMDEAEQFANL